MALADLLASRTAALPAALAAGLVFALVILRLGRGRFSPRLFGVAIAIGAVSAIIPMKIHGALTPFQASLDPLAGAGFKAFFSAGLIEESAKLALAWFIIRRHYLVRTPRDLILAVASVALGFALIENIQYVTRAEGGRAAIAMGRAVTAVPAHVFMGLVLGLGVARAETRRGLARAGRLFAGALLPAALIHGLYDFPLFLAERGPPYPAPVAWLAERLSIAAPSLLETASLIATLFGCLGAVFVIRALDRMPDERDRGFTIAPVRPVWLDRALRAVATGRLAAGLLLAVCFATMALALDTILSGALPLVAFDTARFCLCPATLGWALLTTTRGRAALRGGSTRGGWPMAAAAAALAIAAVSPLDPLRNGVLAHTLIESGATRAQSGDFDKAADNFTAALGYAPDDAATLTMRAGAELAADHLDRALDDAGRLLAIDPGDAAALMTRAAVRLRQREYARAESDLDDALKSKRDDPRLLGMRAESREYQGKTALADDDLDRAIKGDPTATGPRITQVELLLERPDLDGALRAIEASSHLDPDRFTFLLGRTRFHRRQFDAAVAAFRSDRDFDPAYVSLWLFLAQARMGQDGRGELATRAERFTREKWPYPLVELLLGAKTIAETQAAARDADQTCEVDYYSGELLLARGERDLGVRALRRAAAGCPANYVEFGAARIELRELPDAPGPAIGSGPQPARLADPAPGAEGSGSRETERPAAPASPETAQSPPWSPAAFAPFDSAVVLTGGARRLEGVASWRVIAPSAAPRQHGALQADVFIPDLELHILLTLRKDSTPGEAESYSFVVETKRKDSAWRNRPAATRRMLAGPVFVQPGGLRDKPAIADPRSQGDLDLFTAQMSRAEMRAFLAAWLAHRALEAPLTDDPNGGWRLRIELDAAAGIAARRAIDQWGMRGGAGRPA